MASKSRRILMRPRAIAHLAALLTLFGCSQNIQKLNGKDAPPPPPPHAATQAPGGPGEQPSAMPRGLSANDLASPVDQGTPPGVSGTVTVAPSLADRIPAGAVLFLFATDGSGPPLAVRRVVAPRFPLRFFLGQESVMFEGSTLEGSVTVVARISRSGAAGPAQSGDLEGSSGPGAIKVGSEGVEIRIDQVK